MTFAENPFTTGGLDWQDYARAGVIFLCAVVVAIGLQRLLTRLLEREGSERLTARVAGRFLGYLIVSIGFVYALHSLGVTIGPVVGALGIGGLALALASQDILANALDGLLLEVRRPFRRGDQVMTLDKEGVVEDVNLRTVVIRTFDGQRVYIPNTTVFRNPIVNYTQKGMRRTTVEVGLAYDSSLVEAKEIALEACCAVDEVRPSPEPEAWVTEFGDSTVALSVRFWHAPDNQTMWRVRDAVMVALKRAYDDVGIEIAFPQAVVHLANGQAPARRRGSAASRN